MTLYDSVTRTCGLDTEKDEGQSLIVSLSVLGVPGHHEVSNDLERPPRWSGCKISKQGRASCSREFRAKGTSVTYRPRSGTLGQQSSNSVNAEMPVCIGRATVVFRHIHDNTASEYKRYTILTVHNSRYQRLAAVSKTIKTKTKANVPSHI